MTDISAALCLAMRRITGMGGDITGLARLSGGANMESSSFDFGGYGYVLRRAPSAEMMASRPFGHGVEATLVRTARMRGVRAPEIVGELVAGDGLGSGYIMRRIEGEVNPAKILGAPPRSLITDIARELAAIHAIPLSDITVIAVMDTYAALDDLKCRFIEYGGDRPVLALAIRWCEDNLPESAPPVLVHGDFRMCNLMVDDTGLAAVLDWELAHIGDAHEDLAWGCVGAWRFGHYDKPAFGCADFERYFAAYEEISGRAVETEQFWFWLIYRTLWWALGCLQMAEVWRSGADRSLERVVIGRRTIENEIDLLMMLEEDAPQCERVPVTLHPLPQSRRQGEPSTTELLEAIGEWITSDVKPRSQGRDRFMAAVAVNALGIATRELARPVALHDKALCDAVLSGQTTLATPGLLRKLRAATIAKLEADAPKYAGLEAARRKWGVSP
jgi:aminoglycoside phosphotransferase (APT) family kinase protein